MLAASIAERGVLTGRRMPVALVAGVEAWRGVWLIWTAGVTRVSFNGSSPRLPLASLWVRSGIDGAL